MAEATKTKPKQQTSYSPRLKQEYETKWRKELMSELKLKNINEAPSIEKVVINVGLGRAKDEKRLLEVAANTLRKITGQQPVSTVARMSIASFKLREGNRIGMKVTLRGARMYEFLDRLVNIVLPRLRDFHGVSTKAFDRQGNYSIGLVDQSVFPELSYEDTSTAHGLQVIIVTKTKQPEHARVLIEKFGFPFEKGDR
jgi:large subunit ribosomal protein L5